MGVKVRVSVLGLAAAGAVAAMVAACSSGSPGGVVPRGPVVRSGVFQIGTPLGATEPITLTIILAD